jgi:hypothetical protein
VSTIAPGPRVRIPFNSTKNGALLGGAKNSNDLQSPQCQIIHIHLRGFFSSITAHVAAAVIPPSATSSKISSGVPSGVISSRGLLEKKARW